MDEKVTIIIPAFNEEENIIEVLRPIVRWKRADPVNRHVIVVNDGSTDKTQAFVREFNSRFDKPQVDIIYSDSKTKKNLGKGEAFVRGVLRANRYKPDILMTIDADTENLVETRIDDLIIALKSRPEINMVLGRCIELGYPLPKDLTGTRAIRMRALAPIINRKRKWIELLRGFALERALNYLIRKRFHSTVCFHQAPPFRSTNFDGQEKHFYSYSAKLLDRQLVADKIAAELRIEHLLIKGQRTAPKTEFEKCLSPEAQVALLRKRVRRAKRWLSVEKKTKPHLR